ncbi:hypothetical protein Plec18167_004958 [Paecilomyces lecythidis]|uniref:Xylanolytic transcriptional activator regulatory domain-containing protein n=1 Tax=Paecilomyces lecythidis TaxID=3004212 RepID=A0ABR3XMR3_9EURO
MAQVDLADGRLQRGYAAIALGLRILQSEGLNKDHNIRSLSNCEVEERLRIAWAFFMLDRTYNASRDYSLCLSDKHFTLHFPSPDTPEGCTEQESRARGTLHCAPAKQGHKVDHGILACLLRLYSIWGKAAEYVFEPSNKDALSPWQAGSELAAVESNLLEFETHFADMHRYINVDFSRRAREEPQSRAYLSTWLCVQLLFHSIHCLLHHPFVVMIKVRQMDRNTPATFLQKSFENSVLHSRWIARIIREMSEVGFRLYDPFFGYLSAIAAIIQLEYTISKNEQVALIVNKDFMSLIDFMAGLAAHWDNMRVLVCKSIRDKIPLLTATIQVNRVNELASRHKNYRSLYYNGDGYSGALSSMPTPSNIPKMSAEDETLMWNILDLSSFPSGTEITNTIDTSPSQGQGMVTPDVHIPEQPILPTMPEETHALSGNQRIPVFQGVQSQDTPLFYGHNQGSIGQEPVSEWSFTNRSSADQLGTAMPDIPDWLIVGEYMEYL